MTELDLQLAQLRTRRPAFSFVRWLRTKGLFDRRSIRDPAERDRYWATMQRRLAESDAAFLLRWSHDPHPPRPTAS